MRCPVDRCKYEVLDACEIMNVIQESAYARLGVAEADQPYIVPVCFRCELRDGQLVIRILSRPVGHKVHCITQNDRVALEFERCGCCAIESVLLTGTATVLEASGERDMAVIEVRASQTSGRRYLRDCEAE